MSCDQLLQKAYHYKKTLSIISDKSNKLGNFSIKTVNNLLVQLYFLWIFTFLCSSLLPDKVSTDSGFPLHHFLQISTNDNVPHVQLTGKLNSPEYGFMCNYRRGIRSDFDFVSYVKDLSTHVLATAKVTNGFSPLKWNETC